MAEDIAPKGKPVVIHAYDGAQVKYIDWDTIEAIKTALQLIDDLRPALKSVGTDKLLVEIDCPGEPLGEVLMTDGVGGSDWETPPQFVRADKDSDGDYDPLTSTSWDGDSFSAKTGTIDWNADFGVPASAKAVNLYLIMRDSGAGTGYNISFKAKSITTNWSKGAYIIVGGDVVHVFDLTVPIASDGTTYYQIAPSAANTMDIWIRVVGWYI